jgi:mannose-6-phosphate isomerase-like protein (cupin superfamily)
MADIKPRRIKLSLESNEYQRLLKRGVDAVSMHSGLVTLEPGKSVGNHSTGNCEEIIIVLDGRGEMVLNNDEDLEMDEGFILYCPPYTEHNIKNTGEKYLKYIYVAAKTI